MIVAVSSRASILSICSFAALAKRLFFGLLFVLPFADLPSLSYDLSSPPASSNNFKSRVAIGDVSPPLMVKNGLTDYSVVQVLPPSAPGSGVIVAFKEDHYYVITAKHVIQGMADSEVLEVMTPDGEYHEALVLGFSKNVDVALLRFRSNNYYYPAFIHDKTIPSSGQESSVIGFALPTAEAREGTLRKSFGEVLTLIENPTNGYDFMYSNVTNRGISGGPVFAKYRTGMLSGLGTWGASPINPSDCRADYFFVPPLLGIHGRGEAYATGGKSGANLGISIHAALSALLPVLRKEGIVSLPKESETRLYIDGCPLYLEAGGN